MLGFSSFLQNTLELPHCDLSHLITSLGSLHSTLLLGLIWIMIRVSQIPSVTISFPWLGNLQRNSITWSLQWQLGCCFVCLDHNLGNARILVTLVCTPIWYGITEFLAGAVWLLLAELLSYCCRSWRRAHAACWSLLLLPLLSATQHKETLPTPQSKTCAIYYDWSGHFG